MKSLLLVVIFVLFIDISQVKAQEVVKLFEITPRLEINYFYWGEYNDNSIQIIEEEGNLLGGGFSSKIKFSRNYGIYTNIEADFYYGVINYNGFLQDAYGNTEAYKSETVYTGLKTALNLGYDFYLSKYFILAPECGLQFEYWNRDIDNGGKYGYDEAYSMLLFDFGGNIVIPISSNFKIFTRILGEYPLIIEESIDLASRGQGGPASINLEPNSNIGLNFELGTSIYGSSLSFYLDYMLFSKSAEDQGYHQPESDRSVVGIKLGFTF